MNRLATMSFAFLAYHWRLPRACRIDYRRRYDGHHD